MHGYRANLIMTYMIRNPTHWIIGVARRGRERGHGTPTFLENTVILRFERLFSKQNSVIRLKSNILAPPNFFDPTTALNSFTKPSQALFRTKTSSRIKTMFQSCDKFRQDQPHSALFWANMSTITLRDLSHFVAHQVITGIPAHTWKKHFTQKKFVQISMQQLEGTLRKNQLLKE